MQDRANVALSELSTALTGLQGSSTKVDSLQAIARVRFGLAVTADIVVDMLSAGGEATSKMQERRHSLASLSYPYSPSAAKLLLAAREMCNAIGDPQLQLFLCKLLVRNHGMDVMQRIRDHPDLRWISALQQRQEVRLSSYTFMK